MCEEQIVVHRVLEKKEGRSVSGIGEIAAISPRSMDKKSHLLQSIGNASGSLSASILIIVFDLTAQLIFRSRRFGYVEEQTRRDSSAGISDVVLDPLREMWIQFLSLCG